MKTPEEMTDDELIGARVIVECAESEDGDGTWEAVLDCGHEVTFVGQPRSMELEICAQCVDIFLDRRKESDASTHR